jgi:uncharacterized protein YndB with AHSA1/START domain
VADRADAVVREIEIDASPETIFEFFVDADKLTRWLAVEATLDPRRGGVCHQVHAGGEGQGRWHMRGTFLEVDPPTRVVLSWGFVESEVGIPLESSTVEVTIRPTAGGTRVRVVHHGLPATEVESHAKGWTEMLDRLAGAAGRRGAEGSG